MPQRLRLLIALAALVGALTLVASLQAMSVPKLVGQTGPGFTITLKSSKGKLVQNVKLHAGKYTFVIHDKSSMHSFALDGPHGFAKDFTSITFSGTKTATVNLKKGKYKYYCKAHESVMFHFFRVV
jgi:plastocyanin